MQRTLVTLGIVIAVVGLLWPWVGKLGLGRLPGDIRIGTGSGTFYFPIVTCIVLSLAVSLLLWLFRR